MRPLLVFCLSFSAIFALDVRSPTVWSEIPSVHEDYSLGEAGYDGKCTSLDGPRCNPINKEKILKQKRLSENEGPSQDILRPLLQHTMQPRGPARIEGETVSLAAYLKEERERRRLELFWDGEDDEDDDVPHASAAKTDAGKAINALGAQPGAAHAAEAEEEEAAAAAAAHEPDAGVAGLAVGPMPQVAEALRVQISSALAANEALVVGSRRALAQIDRSVAEMEEAIDALVPPNLGREALIAIRSAIADGTAESRASLEHSREDIVVTIHAGEQRIQALQELLSRGIAEMQRAESELDAARVLQTSLLQLASLHLQGTFGAHAASVRG